LGSKETGKEHGTLDGNSKYRRVKMDAIDLLRELSAAQGFADISIAWDSVIEEPRYTISVSRERDGLIINRENICESELEAVIDDLLGEEKASTGKYIVRKASGEELDCPCMVLLAKDAFAIYAVQEYRRVIERSHPRENYRRDIVNLAGDMEAWRRSNPGKVKVPD